MPIHNNKIAIIGAGWLGQPLALSLQQQQYDVTVSCTQAAKAQQLSSLGIHAVNAILTDKAEGDWQTLLQGKEVAICLLPPNHGNHGNSSYALQVSLLLQQLTHYNVNKLVFVSSTSVYRKDNALITEESVLNPTASVYEAEQVVLAAAQINTTVVRFAGLISQDRNPTRTLSRRSSDGHCYNAAQTPVNLIHQQDCIAVIEQILAQDCWGEVFNACCDEHASRQAFYQQSAAILAIPTPMFNDADSKPHCLISNAKLKQRLAYEFSHNCIEQLTEK